SYHGAVWTEAVRLQHVAGRVADSAVDVAEFGQREQFGRVFGVAELKASGLIDRYRHGRGCGIAAIAGMQHERFRMLAVGRHFALLLVTLTKPSTATVSRSAIPPLSVEKRK